MKKRIIIILILNLLYSNAQGIEHLIRAVARKQMNLSHIMLATGISAVGVRLLTRESKEKPAKKYDSQLLKETEKNDTGKIKVKIIRR